MKSDGAFGYARGLNMITTCFQPFVTVLVAIRESCKDSTDLAAIYHRLIIMRADWPLPQVSTRF